MIENNRGDENSLIAQIKEKEDTIQTIELDLARLKEELDFLRQTHADSVNIKWRDEIRSSLKGPEEQAIFTSYDVIVNSIETKYHLKASRKIKNSIITTLSLMFKERSIGRVEVNSIYYYGFNELFTDNDLTVVKEEYSQLFEKCRAYVENFEREP